MTLERDMCEILDDIGKKEYCRTRPEVVRLLIRTYREVMKALFGGWAQDTIVSGPVLSGAVTLA